MTETKADRIDEIDTLYDLGEFLYAVYRETDYTIGVLSFGEPMADGEYPDHLGDPPEFMKSGWTMYHEIPMVLHPEKGALLVRRVAPWLAKQGLAAAIEETYSELKNLTYKIRRRLDEVGGWQDQPFVMGAGVVTTRMCPGDRRPLSVPDVALIDRDGIRAFPQRIDGLFEHWGTECASPVESWGEALVEAVTESPGVLGDFYDEASLGEHYREFERNLEGVVEARVPG